MELRVALSGDQRVAENLILEVRAIAQRCGLEIPNIQVVRQPKVEILGYFAAGNNPSGVFSLASLAKTVSAREAVQVALSAVRAIERRPSGAFFAELKE